MAYFPGVAYFGYAMGICMATCFSRLRRAALVLTWLLVGLAPGPALAQVTASIVSIESEITDRQDNPTEVRFIIQLSEPIQRLEIDRDTRTVDEPYLLPYEFVDGVVNPLYPEFDLADTLFVDDPVEQAPGLYSVSILLGQQPEGEAVFRMWLAGAFRIVEIDNDEALVTGVRSNTPAFVDLTANTGSNLSTLRELSNAASPAFEVTVQFDAPVTGFGLEDLELVNATARDLTGADDRYAFFVDPIAEGALSVAVPFAAAEDAALVPTGRSNTLDLFHDATPPVISAVSSTQRSSPSNQAEFDLLFTVSEPLELNALTSALDAALSSTGGLNSRASANGPDAEGREVVRITSTPGTQGTLSFANLAAGAVTDLAGNPTTVDFTGMPPDVDLDLIRPTAAVDFSDVVDGGNTILSGTAISASELTVNFALSETASGAEASDFTIGWSGATAPSPGNLTTDGNLLRYRIAGIEGDGRLTVTLSADAVQDVAGNGNEPASLDLDISNTPILAEINPTTNRTELFVNPDDPDPFLSFTVRWNKPVSGMDAGDFSFISDDGLTVRRLDFELLSGTAGRITADGISNREGSFRIAVAAGAVVDGFGNTSSAGFVSPTVTLVRPTQRVGLIWRFSNADLVEGDDSNWRLDGREIRFGPWALTPRPSGGPGVARIFYDASARRLSLDGQLRVAGGSAIIASGNFDIVDASGGGQVLTGRFTPGVLDLLGAPVTVVSAIFPAGSSGNSMQIEAEDVRGTVRLDVLTIEPLVSGELLSLTPLTGLYIGDSSRLGLSAVTPAATGFDAAFDGRVRDQTNTLRGQLQLRADSTAFADVQFQVQNVEFSVGQMQVSSFDVIELRDLEYSNSFLRASIDAWAFNLPLGVDGINNLTLRTLSGDLMARMSQPVQEGAKLVSTAAQVMDQRGPFVRAEWEISPFNFTVNLPEPHTLVLGPTGLIQASADSATVDRNGYRTETLTIASNLGPFIYDSVSIPHLSSGIQQGGNRIQSPGASVGVFGGLGIGSVNMPLVLGSVLDRLFFFGEVSLPIDFQLHRVMTVRGEFARTSSSTPINADSIDRAEACVPTGNDPAPIPSMGQAKVSPFCLVYTNPPPTWLGTLKTLLPIRNRSGQRLELDGLGEIVTGKWNRIEATVSGLEKPIGTTGAFLNALGAGMDNLARVEECWFEFRGFAAGSVRQCGVKPVEFSGRAQISFGPKIDELPSKPRLLVGDILARVNDTRTRADGDLFLLNPRGLRLAQGFANVEYAKRMFRAGADQTVFPNVTGRVRLSGNFFSGINPHATGEAVFRLKIPDEVPLVGGETVSKAELTIKALPVSMRGSFSVIGIGVSVEITTEPRVSFGKSALRSWESPYTYRVDGQGKRIDVDATTEVPYYRVLGNYNEAQKLYRSAGSKAASRVQVPGGEPTFIRVSYANRGAAAEVVLVGPDGTRYTTDTVETDTRRSAPVGLLRNPLAGDLAYVFANPKAGEYRVELRNPEALGEAAVEVLVKNATPSFAFGSLASNGSQLQINWSASDADDDATVSLYLDSNRRDFDGIPVQINRPISDGSSAQVDLAALSLSPGQYWVYALVDDGVNPLTRVYSELPVFVANPDAPAPVRGVRVSVSGDAALVSWQPSADPGVSGYSVKWTERLEDSDYDFVQSAATDQSSAQISGLSPDTAYRFTVVAQRGGNELDVRRKQLDGMARAARGGPLADGPLAAHQQAQVVDLKQALASQSPLAASIAAGLKALPAAGKGEEEDLSALLAESEPREFVVVTTPALTTANNPPRFVSEPPLVIEAGQTLAYAAGIADSDGDSLSLSLVSGPTGMQLVGNELRWNSDPDGGLFEVELSLSDGTDQVSQAWTLAAATALVDELRLSAAQPAAAVPGMPWLFPALDIAGCSAPVSYRLLGAPAGMSIDSAGILQWQVPSTAGDDLQVTVIASQTCSATVLSASREYLIDVGLPSTNRLVTFPPGCEAPPTATVSGPVPQAGGSANLRVDMSGSGPWRLLWSDGELAENVTSSPYFRTLAPNAAPGPYSVVAFSDATCSGTANGSGGFNPIPLEPAVIPASDAWARWLLLALIALGVLWQRERLGLVRAVRRDIR